MGCLIHVVVNDLESYKATQMNEPEEKSEHTKIARSYMLQITRPNNLEAGSNFLESRKTYAVITR